MLKPYLLMSLAFGSAFALWEYFHIKIISTDDLIFTAIASIIFGLLWPLWIAMLVHGFFGGSSK